MNIPFFIFMFICLLLTPLVMIFFGRKFKKFSPKNINQYYGYRSQTSMKNRDTWDFAHKNIGKLWESFGFTLLPFTVLPAFFVIREDVETVGTAVIILMALQLVGLILPIFIVEKRLKNTFDKYGRRKSHWE